MLRALLGFVALMMALPQQVDAQVPDLEGLATATADVIVGKQIPARPAPLDSASAWESVLMAELTAADYPEYRDPFLWVKVRHSEVQLVDSVAEVTISDAVCTDRDEGGFLVGHTYVHSFVREADSWVYLDSRLQLSGSGDCEAE